MLADDLLEDARNLAITGDANNRKSCMRRAISTAYYAVFHLLVEDFVEHWEFEDQRARMARMFNHRMMKEASFEPADKKKPTPAECTLMEVRAGFQQLQEDRHRADYDLAWNIVPTDAETAIALAETTFQKWRSIRGEDIARHHLLSMFGAKR